LKRAAIAAWLCRWLHLRIYALGVFVHPCSSAGPVPAAVAMDILGNRASNILATETRKDVLSSTIIVLNAYICTPGVTGNPILKL